jgi:flagellin
MALIINTNMASLNAQRNLTKSQSQLQTALQRLSSGMRVNSAKDDAAGLYNIAIETAQIRGTNQAKRNASDGISFAQTAEGAMGEINNNLQRIRELAVQSANGATSDSARSGIQKEVDQLTQEISRIVSTSNFNGTQLLDGTNSTVNFQVGADGQTNNQVSMTLENLTGISGYSSSLTATSTIDVSSSGNASAAIGNVESAITSVASARTTMGAIQNRFDAVISNLSTYSENLTAARSRVQDADFAAETANLSRAQILQQAGTAMVAQANTLPQTALTLLR